MPEFVSHVGITRTKDNKKETTEVDDEYHTGKFRTPEPKKAPSKDS